jgi:hypothetical protein
MSQWHQVKVYLFEVYKSALEQAGEHGTNDYPTYLELSCNTHYL